MKFIFHFSLLGLIFCNPVKGDIRDFCAKCITSTCDKSKIIRDLFQWSLKECTQIQNQKANSKIFEYNERKDSKIFEYNEKRDMLDFYDWTKNQVGIYFKMNQKYIKRGEKLPMPDCLGTLVSPKIILTDAACAVQSSRL